MALINELFPFIMGGLGECVEVFEGAADVMAEYAGTAKAAVSVMPK